jgi:hypothetical protein
MSSRSAYEVKLWAEIPNTRFGLDAVMLRLRQRQSSVAVVTCSVHGFWVLTTLTLTEPQKLKAREGIMHAQPITRHRKMQNTSGRSTGLVETPRCNSTLTDQKPWFDWPTSHALSGVECIGASLTRRHHANVDGRLH